MRASKVVTQFVMARLPFANSLYDLSRSALNPNVHSVSAIQSRIPDYLDVISRLSKYQPITGADVFELGTGWCPAATILLSLCNAKRIVSVDHARHLKFGVMRNLILAIEAEARVISSVLGVSTKTLKDNISKLKQAPNLESLLDEARISYHAPYDALSTTFPGNSFDIYFNYSVLENIPLPVLIGLMQEAERITKKTGVMASVVGCQDPFAEPGREASGT